MKKKMDSRLYGQLLYLLEKDIRLQEEYYVNLENLLKDDNQLLEFYKQRIVSAEDMLKLFQSEYKRG